MTGLAIRLYGLATPPLDFHPARQYHSALMARSYYYHMQQNIPEWQRQAAMVSAQREPALEPPILEMIAALGYRAAGGEDLRIPRLVSIFCWLIGGIFLFLIALKMISFEGAILTVAFYLLLPFGVEASRSFQPEPMMMMFLLMALYLIIHHDESLSMQSLIIGAVFSALAILIKPSSLFFLYGAYVSMILYRNHDLRALINRDSLIFFSISLLPAFLFYGYGIIVAGYMRWKIQTSFVPQLLFQFNFWDGWLKRVRSVMGFTAFLGGFLSVLAFRTGWQKFLLLGLWAGYFAFAFIFTYHIHTHDYYHLPLIPIVALSLSYSAILLFERMFSESKEWYWRFMLGSAVLAAFVLSAGTSIQATRKMPSFESELRNASAMGDLVHHSTKILILDEFDGKSLMYHGEFSAVYWPHEYDIRDGKLWNEPEMTVEDRFLQLNDNNTMHYFIVTDLSELSIQTELNSFLRSNFAIFEENDDYIIFDLQRHLSLKLSK